MENKNVFVSVNKVQGGYIVDGDNVDFGPLVFTSLSKVMKFVRDTLEGVKSDENENA